MRVTALETWVAHVEARGSERTVSLLMMAEGGLQVGDYVLVNLGHAIQKMSEEEALASWDLLDQIEAASFFPPHP